MSEASSSAVPVWSLESYGHILESAGARGYATSCFRDFDMARNAPVLLLRHDLDHSLRAARTMAEFESELGIKSTYFVQVTCDFYNLLGEEGRAAVSHLVDLGHEVGLHYDARRYAEAARRGGNAEAERVLQLDLAILEDIAGDVIVSASQHIPIEGDDFDVLCRVENEAYEPRFTQGEMSYISDSLMAWRQATPFDLLMQGVSFQLLTHPMKWGAPIPDMHSALRRARIEECEALCARYDEIEGYYDNLLRRRSDLDARFRERRDGGRKDG